MTLVAFLSDAPDSVVLSKGTATSRVQIAKTGNFEDPRYGKFSITLADFNRWKTNFAALSTAQDRAGLPVDIDHGPETRGNTEAAGWVVKLDNLGKEGDTDTPNELWATVEWNTLGQELVKDRRYLYLSPSYQHDFKDETGRSHGTALVGVGLTNRPFLSMATVSLSQSLAVEVPSVGRTDSLSQMPTLIEQLRQTFGLSADADDATVLAAANSAQAAAADNTNANPGNVSLSALAQKQGMVVLSVADHLSLSARAAAGDVASASLKATKFDTAFDGAVAKGAVLPAMKSTFELSYGVDADATIKTLSELPGNVVAPVTPTGYTGDPKDDTDAPKASGATLAAAQTEGWGVDDDRADLDTKATTLMAANPGMDYLTAVERVQNGG